MSEENNNVTAKPAKTRTRTRRNYQSELAGLQSRVDTALRLLAKCKATAESNDGLLDVAIEILEGEE